MKKKTISAIAMSLVLIAGILTACGSSKSKEEASSDETTETSETSSDDTEEKEAGPYEGLTLYESASGVSIYMDEGFKESSEDGFVCFYERDDCAMNCQEETFEVLESAGYDSNMSLEEYAKLIADLYDTGSEVQTDEYDNVYIVYSQDVDGMNFTYYDFFDKGSTSFWATNFMCITEDKDDFEDDFKLWGSSITVP